MKNRFTTCITLSIIFMLSVVDGAMARNISFQPRVDAGVMYYEFQSEADAHNIWGSQNFTQSSLKYQDLMPFVSAGATLFGDRFFLDVGGQYAFDGNSSTTSSYSLFEIKDDNQSSSYMAFEPYRKVEFSRLDTAVSLGYAMSSELSLYAGYKWAETEFKEKYLGHFTATITEPNAIGKMGGRMWGEGSFTFKYTGPFIGIIKGWDFQESRFLKGVLTTNIALAYLRGEVTFRGTRDALGYGITDWINDQQIDGEPQRSGLFISRQNTEGDSLGLKVNLSWRGATPWEGLSYIVSLSGFRYEFEAEEGLPNMNETSVNTTLRLTYTF